MKRIVRATGAAVFACAALAAGSASAGSGPAQIEFGSDFFEPDEAGPIDLRPHAREGRWFSEEPNEDHNVFEDEGMFRSGPPGRGRKFRVDISAGDWHYYCTVHGSVLGGMDGTIAVRPIAGSGDGDSALIRWAGHGGESGNRYELEWREQGHAWHTWKASTAKVKLEFGANGSPVVASPSKAYEVRVRSFALGDPSRRSGLSPAVEFDVR
jgi:hypothetical protein